MVETQELTLDFPYQKKPDGGYFPIIPVTLQLKKGKIELYALIDSGATVSVFRPEVGEQLGLELEAGKEIYLQGVGGHIKGYLHNLNLEAAGKKFECPVIFSHEYAASFNLLGREAFFEQFLITFDEKNSRVRLN